MNPTPQAARLVMGPEVKSPSGGTARDYERIQRAIGYLEAHWHEHPSLDALAGHLGLSAAHLHRMFVRWAGLTPQAFQGALTRAYARRLLRAGESVLETALASGLSGPSRLHDLFVSYEAMSPGAVKTRGAGLVISYGFHATPFGLCLAMATPLGLAGLGFCGDTPKERQDALADMRARFASAQFVRAPKATAPYVASTFTPDAPVKLLLIGQKFQLRVWETLLTIPKGAAVSYGQIARALGQPRAARAVGTAVGRNPISYIVPCHRVLRADGALGGYHWGLVRKRAMIAFESNESGAGN